MDRTMQQTDATISAPAPSAPAAWLKAGYPYFSERVPNRSDAYIVEYPASHVPEGRIRPPQLSLFSSDAPNGAHVWPRQLWQVMTAMGELLATVASVMDWGLVPDIYKPVWFSCTEQLIHTGSRLSPPPLTAEEEIVDQWRRQNHFRAWVAHVHRYFCGVSIQDSNDPPRYSLWLHTLAGEQGWRQDGPPWQELSECVNVKLRDMCEGAPELFLEALREWLPPGGEASEVEKRGNQQAHERFNAVYPPMVSSGPEKRFKIIIAGVEIRGDVAGIWGVPLHYSRTDNHALGYLALSDVARACQKVITEGFGRKQGSVPVGRAAAKFVSEVILQVKDKEENADATDVPAATDDNAAAEYAAQYSLLKTAAHCLLGWSVALPYLLRYVNAVQQSAATVGLRGLLVDWQGPLLPADMELRKTMGLVQWAEQEGWAEEVLPALLMALQDPVMATITHKVRAVLQETESMQGILQQLQQPQHMQQTHGPPQPPVEPAAGPARNSPGPAPRDPRPETRGSTSPRAPPRRGSRPGARVTTPRGQQAQPGRTEKQKKQDARRQAFVDDLRALRAQQLSLQLQQDPQEMTRMLAHAQLKLFFESLHQLFETPQTAEAVRQRVRAQVQLLLQPQYMERLVGLVQPKLSELPQEAQWQQKLEVVMNALRQAQAPSPSLSAAGQSAAVAPDVVAVAEPQVAVATMAGVGGADVAAVEAATVEAVEQVAFWSRFDGDIPGLPPWARSGQL